MQVVDNNGNVFGGGLQVNGPDGKPKTSSGGGSPSGPAGGDLSGSYPNPGVVWANGTPTYDLQYYPLSLNPAGYLTSITSSDVITALGYTPYSNTNPSGFITSAALTPYLTSANAATTYYPLTNPSGYISGITSSDVTSALGFTPYDATNPSGFITSSALGPYLTSATAASTYFPIPTGTVSQYIRGNGTLATFPTIPTVTPSALTKVDDTNVTLTLGGTPASALLQSVSLTLGWTGTLADSRIASASTWNAKQNAITLTTTGTSGAATLVGSTLNIPQYGGGLTVGTTAIASGTVGRILFEGTGNVLQESANLFWDNTNNRLSVGTSTQAYTLAVGGKLRVSAYGYWVDSGANALQVDGTSSFSDNITLVNGKALLFGTTATQIGGTSVGLTFRAGSGSTQMSLFSTGNIAINTTTDSGYKLDVNGTARVQGALTVNTGANTTTFSTNIGNVQIYASGTEILKIQDSSSRNYIQLNTGANRVILSNGCMESTQNSVSRTSFNTNVTQDGTVQVLLSQQNTAGYHNDGFLITKGYFSSTGTQTYNNIFRITNNYISSPTTISGTGSVVGINLDLSQTNGTSTISSRIIALRNGIGDVTLNVNSGNTMIGTETNAGFKLDVNGTARVSGALTLNGGTGATKTISEGATYGVLLWGGTGSNADLTLTDRSGNLRFRIVNGANILQTATTINDVLIGGTSFASKSIYTSGQYGFVFGGSSGTSYHISLFESTGTNGLFVDSAGRAKVGAFNSTFNNSAILEAVSTTQGFLPPRMTNAQMLAIATPAAGLVVYDTTNNKHCGYNGTAWQNFY